MADSVKTLCPYCGVGCGLEVSPTNNSQNSSWKVIGDRAHPSSQGMICVKGATIIESLGKERLEYPRLRHSLTEPFRRASWDEVLDTIIARIEAAIAQQGVDAICMYGSGQLQTEDYYVAQKLLKGCLGTNNFDSNSRLCMSSAVASYTGSFGADGPPCCYEDLDLTDCAFIIGSNTAECHPIVFNRLHKHIKKDPKAKMIVVDPRRTKTAEAADLHLAIQPGTDIDLLNGIAHLLLDWGAIDREFIASHTNGFAEYVEVIKHYSPEFVSRKCGISPEDLQQAARYWADSERVLSLWSQGVNQSSEGTAKGRILINLHLLSGQIGKPAAGPFSLTGQPNAMGGRESGGLAYLLPGYRAVTNPQHRAEVEQFWGFKAGSISPQPGRNAWDIILGLEQEEVGVLWIAATNPAVSMPDLERTKAALLKSPCTIYQDAYYPTETAAYAHILLPAAQWSEKTGTMTNSERVVTLCPQFCPRPGEAKADWEIFAEVGRRLGFAEHFEFADAAAVYREFVQLTRGRPCDMTGMSHELLAEAGALQWPLSANCEDSGNNKRLYTDFLFHTPDGKAQFIAYHSRGLAEPPDEEYPFILTIGRLYGHWHTQTRTGRIEKIVKMHPHPFIEIHPQDAAKLSIEEGNWVGVRSRRGKAQFPAKVTAAIVPGAVFVPMHWGALWADGAEANSLTHSESCPISHQPELKACAVQLVRLGE
jgi:ferredoxin-nitrate reductase